MKKNHLSGFAAASIVLVVLAAIILLCVGVLGGYYAFQKIYENRSEQPQVINPPVGTSSVVVPPASNAGGDDILWMVPKEIPNLKLRKLMGGYDEVYDKYYKVGTFASGKYKDSDLILLAAGCDGPCFQDNYYKFVKSNDKTILLNKHSDEIEMASLDSTKFYIDEDYKIPSLIFPETLSDSKTGQVLKQTDSINAFWNTESVHKIFADEKWGDVYTTNDYINRATQSGQLARNAFYLRAPDGTVRVYTFEPKFVGKDGVPQVRWNDGTQNQEAYVSTDRSGCGATTYISVVSGTVNLEKDLKEVGTNSNGEPVYELKDINHKLLKDEYGNIYLTNGTKPPYDAYVKEHPLFFWVDPFGRIIKFALDKYTLQAECGKPVIYLYPQKTTNVSVKLDPKGGFTYTEPVYGNGWFVRAEPSGELTEIKSQKKYPYLFWEGRGGIYETPKKGFVVEQKSVHKFLVDKLSLLGLNSKETADFIEFWEPKMQDSKYYFVTFMGNDTMNQIAPLTVSPKPDTVIRILMDFKGLEKPIAVEGFNIKTPQRKGFTVVEWGGVLH